MTGEQDKDTHASATAPVSVRNTATGDATVGAQIGVLHGDAQFHQAASGGGRIRNTFLVSMPRGVRNAVITLVASALVAGGVWATWAFVLPEFDPTYKTEFLIDTTGSDAEEITESLAKTVGNSGDNDSLALRSFGGECGSEGNTAQLVDFGTARRQEIADAASAAGTTGGGGKATLQRGIVEAVADFTGPFARPAKQINRVIVVTRHAKDACDDDTAFVEKQIRDRVAAAGLDIEFRMIGYQVPEAEQPMMDQLAASTGATAPMFTADPAQLEAAMDWFANVEPVLRNANRLVDILNPTVEQVTDVVAAIREGRLDVADRVLGQARLAITATDTEYEDLRGRGKTPLAQQVQSLATRLRTHQSRLVESATNLLEGARAGEALDPGIDEVRRVADEYNTEARAMNDILANLRAGAPRGTR
ncbi:MAG: VWA domain-containing protein [Saccharothrix sp.]|nr:VWA domain-containing protein [Saccharothrix sp.]